MSGEHNFKSVQANGFMDAKKFHQMCLRLTHKKALLLMISKYVYILYSNLYNI